MCGVWTGLRKEVPEIVDAWMEKPEVAAWAQMYLVMPQKEVRMLCGGCFLLLGGWNWGFGCGWVGFSWQKRGGLWRELGGWWVGAIIILDLVQNCATNASKLNAGGLVNLVIDHFANFDL